MKCYVYLVAVPMPSSDMAIFKKSRWFTQGWTLQELLAPGLVEFLSADGQRMGTKSSTKEDISEVTKIATEVLQGQSLASCAVSERKGWPKIE